jgi:peroxiredoxin
MVTRRVLFLFAFSISLIHVPSYGQIGTRVPPFKLTDSVGKPVSPDDFAGKIVVLEFWSFKCPVALAYDQRMATLHAKYRDQGVEFFAVASNKNESKAEIVRNAENLNLALPVWLDLDGGAAEICGATHTPSVVVLDRTGIMRYRGAIDNNKQVNEQGHIAYLEDALKNLIANRPVDPAETKVFGCSLKR